MTHTPSRLASGVLVTATSLALVAVVTGTTPASNTQGSRLRALATVHDSAPAPHVFAAGSAVRRSR
ncbi:hypothetical protein JF540_24600 [Salipiger thiooxidans]|uniref:hypothetical protein n=1 Tax=Salipiger thiooxidans TaxID=282683 RepID=UPI001A8D19EA|nr:hypothetical protein [Salipiger thiooxidans]MBN8189870.1 hypothetical protein [Salipiger thiooxidans]